MANISSYLSTLRTTNDGKTIRNAIADITEVVNTDNNQVITLLSGLSPTAIAAAATTATTKAGEAAGSADDAMDSKVVATAQAEIATTKAAEALASKNEAATSQINSGISELAAKASETAALASQGAATTKANESAASAAAALASEQAAAEHEAEIIESRKGKATLGEKIGEIDSQLADIAVQENTLNGVANLRNAISFPENVGLISFRFDDNDLTFYTNAFPALKERGFPCTMSYVANRVGAFPERAKTTDAQILEMCRWGNEIASHSYTHLNTPQTLNEMLKEVVESKLEWENTTKCNVHNFVFPGTWDYQYGYGYPKFDSELGRLILRHYPFCEGYEGSDINSRPIQQRYAIAHKMIDNSTLEQVKEIVDNVSGTNNGVIFLLHSVGNPSTGITTANFIALLDYIKSKQNQGLVDVATCTGLMAAGIGKPRNACTNPSFEKWDSANNLVGFTTQGNPTKVESGAKEGSFALSCTTASYVTFRMDKTASEGSPIYRARVYHKSETGGVARILVGKVGTKYPFVSLLMASTQSWQPLDILFCMPNDTNLFEIALLPSGANPVIYDDLSIVRVG